MYSAALFPRSILKIYIPRKARESLRNPRLYTRNTATIDVDFNAFQTELWSLINHPADR